MTGLEYRKKFGFCKSFAFISEESRQKVREKTLANYDTVIAKNLIENGKKTRCVKGHNKFKHVMTKQRLLILADARSKQDPKDLADRCRLIQHLGVKARWGKI